MIGFISKGLIPTTFTEVKVLQNIDIDLEVKNPKLLLNPVKKIQVKVKKVRDD